MKVNLDRPGAMAGILGCNIDSLPFTYLGSKVGMNHKRSSEWEVVVNKIKNWLRRWNDKKISLGGRITILNSVLSSLPV